MSKGILLFAQNNHSVDYIKQAIYCAKKIKKHLKLPVALATDNREYVVNTFPYYERYIDNIIDLDWYACDQKRTYRDGTMSNRALEWRNHNRSSAYDITPFDETIVMDTDFIIGNDILLNAFDTDQDFLIYRSITDLNMDRPDEHRFNKISDRSVDMYWATVFYFKKTDSMQLFFNLVTHIKENWNFYRLMYQIPNRTFRNDFAFSIAIHMLNGFQRTNWPKQLPGRLWFTSDSDVLMKMDDEQYTFILDKKHWEGHYTVGNISDANIHIMNKFSLDRAISEVLKDE
tara:strand:- start:10897 stop:11757 length:861 start_codon:yes stop_codon:yes gene_type:complete